MGIRARRRETMKRPGNAPVYRRAFVRVVHRVLATAFEQLAASTLATKEETAITGLLVDRMRTIVEGRACPRGARSFSIHDDRPESAPGMEGKERSRVDIVVERAGRGPRPLFHFEAKRLHASDSVAAYVGDDGMGCFLSGRYAAGLPDAGMLGYVQADLPAVWAGKIQRKLEADRHEHGLPRTGPCWEKHDAFRGLAHTYRTLHVRRGRPLSIYHVLLLCA